MATTLHDLKTWYGSVMRADFAHITPAHQALLSNLATQMDAGTLSAAAAQQQIVKLAIDTTSVSSLAYNFFTGAIPYETGFDYLVSPNGPNPNNLNSAYYQSANLENRYINFAVNLGKLGEGRTPFYQGYSGLTLAETVTKAYTEIFGAAPDAAKVNAILYDQVPNGVGGTYARAEYFGFYGRDQGTSDLLGTKAALVGWLMAEAAKADTGAYVQANNAFLTDLVADGWASFRSNLVLRYGPPSTGSTGATIAFGPEQSVSPTPDASLRSTENNDTLTGTSLAAGRSLVTVGGNDTITASGTIAGSIDTGEGNDTVTALSVGPSSGANGQIRLGAGNDTLTFTGQIAYGAGIDGGPGDDTLVGGFESGSSLPGTQVVNVEHLVITNAQLATPNLFMGGMNASFNDITVRGTTSLISLLSVPNEIAQFRVQEVSSGQISFQYAGRYYSNPTYGDGRPRLLFESPEHADLNLDRVRVAAGQSLVVGVTAQNNSVYVENDAVLTTLGGGNLKINGPGKLTTGLGASGDFDGREAAELDLTRVMTGAYQERTVVLSGYDDRIALDATRAPEYAGRLSVTLGAGADTVSLYQMDAAYRFANLRVTGGQVESHVRILDFVKGADHVVLGAGGSIANLTQFVGAATSLEQALANVSPSLAVSSTGVFEFGGDTFVYRQDGTVGPNTGDGLIRLVGVTGLTLGTAATADIQYS